MSCCRGRRLSAFGEETPYYGPGAQGYDYSPVDDPGRMYTDPVLHPRDYVGGGSVHTPASNKGTLVAVGAGLLALAAWMAS